MNCCDYNCSQGRNCPARATKIAEPSEATAGKIQANEELEDFKIDSFDWIFVLIAGLLILTLGFWLGRVSA